MPVRTALMFVALAIATTAAALPQSSSPKKADSKNKPITLVGCVAGTPAEDGQMTFADAKSGETYTLAGTDARKYAGQRVEIVGTPQLSNKVRIRTGLTPTPNVAAQAGAMDPAQAAIATATGGTAAATGNPELPTFQIRSVKPVTGDCPKP